MKEPRRLLSHGATDFERQLLRAVVSERPSALLRSRMQKGLGLVGPLAWASSVKAMLGSMAAKVTGGVALGTIVAAGGIAAVSLIPGSTAQGPALRVQADARTEAATPAPQLETMPQALALPPAVVEAEVAAAPEAPAPSEPGAEVTAAPEAALAVDPGAADEADGDRQLREEIALLDTARSALQRGERDAARESLETYRERFPNGILSREAKVLSKRAQAKRVTRRAAP